MSSFAKKYTHGILTEENIIGSRNYFKHCLFIALIFLIFFQEYQEWHFFVKRHTRVEHSTMYLITNIHILLIFPVSFLILLFICVEPSSKNPCLFCSLFFRPRNKSTSSILLELGHAFTLALWFKLTPIGIHLHKLMPLVLSMDFFIHSLRIFCNFTSLVPLLLWL